MSHRQILLSCVAVVLLAGAWLHDRAGSRATVPAGFGVDIASDRADPDPVGLPSVTPAGHPGRTAVPATGSGDSTSPDSGVTGPTGAITAMPAQAQAGTGSQTFTIADLNGHGRVVPALRLQLPADWQGQGGFDWFVSSQCTQAVPELSWQATSPDGAEAFELLPARVWQSVTGQRDPPLRGCPMADMTDARSYLRWLAGQRRPQGRLLDYRSRPDLASEVQVPEPSTPTGSGIEVRHWADAGELLLEWREGRNEMRETMAVSMLVQEVRSPGAFGEIHRTLIVEANPVAVLRAPDHRLDVDRLTHILATVQVDPEWSRLLQAHRMTMNRIERQGVAARARIHADSHAEISRIQHEGFMGRQASDQAAHQRQVQGIHESQTFTDPGTGLEIDLSSHYRRAWELNDGTRIQSDRADFEPYRDLGVDGRELQPAR